MMAPLSSSLRFVDPFLMDGCVGNKTWQELFCKMINVLSSEQIDQLRQHFDMEYPGLANKEIYAYRREYDQGN